LPKSTRETWQNLIKTFVNQARAFVVRIQGGFGLAGERVRIDCCDRDSDASLGTGGRAPCSNLRAQEKVRFQGISATPHCCRDTETSKHESASSLPRRRYEY
jgi:hypothetical protein